MNAAGLLNGPCGSSRSGGCALVPADGVHVCCNAIATRRSEIVLSALPVSTARQDQSTVSLASTIDTCAELPMYELLLAAK